MNFPSSVIEVYCNNDIVLTTSPSYNAWQIMKTSNCQADSSGEATIKFLNTQCDGDCTIFIDNVIVKPGNDVIL